MVEQNIVDFLDGQSSVDPLDVLQLAGDEIVLAHDLVHEVVSWHVLAVDDHVIYQVEL